MLSLVGDLAFSLAVYKLGVYPAYSSLSSIPVSVCIIEKWSPHLVQQHLLFH